MIDAREPLANENEMTPAIIITEQKILSKLLFPVISPYPTVVIVVTAQYIDAAYKSTSVKF